MNKQLKALSRTIFGMFLVLLAAVTMIQFVSADELRNNQMNQRTLMNSYKVERGSILVAGEPIAYSVATDDSYHYIRNYKDGALYAPITGYYSRTQGMTGLEQAMNQELAGTSNAQFFTRLMNTLNGVDPQGASVATTINPKAQQAAMAALSEGGFSGAVVALEPKTGKILALASTPSFDPSLLSSNNNAEIIENYGKLSDEPTKPLDNRAIAGDLYHPGSVYKLVVSAAAIENGAATPSTEFDNPATLPLPQSTSVLHNSTRGACGGDAKATLEQAIIYSCNIPIAELAMSMDKKAVPEMAEKFGFGQEITIPLKVTPSEAPIPRDAAQTALSSIGQLDDRVTPLQVALVSAGIANNGKVMRPYLVDRVLTPDLKVSAETKPEVFSTPISQKTAELIAGMMEKGVANADGYAHMAAINGVRVAGKTGTAENGTTDSGQDRPYTLWFTGFAPVDDPKVAIAVVIENGGGKAYNYQGSSYELPTAVGKRVMEAVLSE